MATLSTAVAALGVIGSSVWLWFLSTLIRHPGDSRSLADRDDPEPAGGWPSVAMIVAARDEAGGVERGRPGRCWRRITRGWR